MTPPRLATRLLRWAAGRADAPYVLNDLAEEFDQIAHRDGGRAASRWYWRQALTSLAPLARNGGRVRRLTRLHVRSTFRAARRSPGTAAAVVATLALGIGAATAIFSVVDAVLLQPLPYGDADRLVSLWERRPDGSRLTVSAANLNDYVELRDTFSDVAAWVRVTQLLGTGVDLDEIAVDRVTWNLWPALGVRPALGRAFTEEDARSGATIAMVTETFWRQRMGAPSSLVDVTLTLDHTRRTVIGVLPPGFRAPSEFASRTPAGVFVPAPLVTPGASRGDRSLRAIARLAPGVAAERAQADLSRLSADLGRTYPETNREVRAALAPLASDISRNVRTSIVLILGAVSLVVIIACVNVANLLLVWSTAERRDIAIRHALGATRADVVMEYLVRGVVFGATAGVLGIVLGAWIRDALVALAPPGVIPQFDTVALNARVLAVAVGLAVIGGITASVVPVLAVAMRRTVSGLHEHSTSVVGGRHVWRWRGVLVVVQMTAAVVLALGAGLLLRSFVLLNRVDLGFAVDRVATMNVRLPGARYPDAAARLRFFETVAERVGAIPGVQSVAYANQFPLRGGWGGGIRIESASGAVDAEAEMQAVSPDYFATLGMTLVAGRHLDGSDRSGAPGAVVVSQTFARRFLPGEDPLGRIVRRDAAAPPLTIVGVVGEVRRDGKLDAAAPQVYFSAHQPALYASDLSALAVRTAGDPRAMLPEIRRAVAAIDPQQVVGGVRTLEEIVDASVSPRRFMSSVLAILASLAVCVSLVGVYAVVRSVVSQRQREIALRMALGATRRQVIAAAAGGGLRWAAAGLVAGVLAAAAASSVLSSFLFETDARDPATFAVVVSAMAVVAVVAAAVPARRAAACEPVRALRE